MRDIGAQNPQAVRARARASRPGRDPEAEILVGLRLDRGQTQRLRRRENGGQDGIRRKASAGDRPEPRVSLPGPTSIESSRISPETRNGICL